MLMSVYLLLWGVNSFAFSATSLEPMTSSPSIELRTHIIPLVQVNGAAVKFEDLMAVISISRIQK